MRRTERLWLSVFVACVLPLSAAGSEGDLLDDTPLGSLSFENADAPVVVSASELRFDYRASRILYRGSVNVKQGNLVIDCGELEISYEGEPRGDDKLEIRSITARGDVVIRQGSRRATGDEARFDQVEKKVLLLGNARIEDGASEVEGDRLTVFLDEGRSIIEASDKKRVSAVLFPNQDATLSAGEDIVATPTPAEATDE